MVCVLQVFLLINCNNKTPNEVIDSSSRDKVANEHRKALTDSIYTVFSLEKNLDKHCNNVNLHVPIVQYISIDPRIINIQDIL